MKTSKERKPAVRIQLTLSREDYEKLFQAYSHSASRSLAAYLRNVLIKGKVTVFYRNTSADELVQQMTGIKEVLWEIRDLFDEQLQSFHSVTTSTELEIWARIQAKSKQALFEKTDEIRLLMIKQYDLCWHE